MLFPCHDVYSFRFNLVRITLASLRSSKPKGKYLSGFPSHILEALLGSCYHIYVFIVDPADAGFRLIARPRQYLILMHKLKTELVNDITGVYDCVKDNLSNNLASPKDCLLADTEEIDGEVLEIASKRIHLRTNSYEPRAMVGPKYVFGKSGRGIGS